MYYSAKDSMIYALLGHDDMGLLKRFAKLLPSAIAALKKLQEEPVWGRLIPFDGPKYGKPANGYVVAADMVLTKEGVRIVELDFVPNGRGVLLSSLPQEGHPRNDFLQVYAAHYETIGWKKKNILYATARGALPRDTEIFSACMRERGFNIRAVHMDEVKPDDLENAVVDRLFMADEVQQSTRDFLATADLEMSPSESWLDSKMVPAALRIAPLEGVLPEARETINSLIAETYALPSDRMGKRVAMETATQLCGGRQRLVLKVADTESHTSWGAHGVLVGSEISQQQFLDAGSEERFGDGRRCVIQRRCESVDFRSIWESSVLTYSNPMGYPWACPELKHRDHIHARIRAFFLVTSGKGSLVPYGMVTLRANPLVHGASDSLSLAAHLH